MPAFVDGVINLRGKIVSIVDLRRRLKIEGSVRTKSSRILIIEVENKIIGLLVDAVNAILRIPPEAIEPAPDIITAVGREYILGVGKLTDKLIILLSLKNIVRPDEISRLAAEDRMDTSLEKNPGKIIEAAA